MSTKFNCPAKYGSYYGSVADAARFIAHNLIVEFVNDYPNFVYPYNAATMNHYNKGNNNAAVHYVYNVINHHLLGSATSGRRQPYPGWARVIAPVVIAAPPVITASPVMAFAPTPHVGQAKLIRLQNRILNKHKLANQVFGYQGIDVSFDASGDPVDPLGRGRTTSAIWTE